MATTNELLDQVIQALEGDEPDPEAALELLDRVLADHPDNVDALLMKAEALVLADTWEEAEELLEESARRLPASVPLVLALADLIVEFHPDDPAALEEAAALAVRGEAAARKQKLDAALIAELRFAAGRAMAALGRPSEALSLFEAARESLPDDPELLLAIAMDRFELLQFKESRDELLKLEVSHPDDARVQHYLGLVAERTQDDATASRYFARAHSLDPDEFTEGVQLSEAEFEATVEKALSSLPERVRDYLKNVPVMVEGLPSVEDLSSQEPPLSPLSLGMFRGLPGAERSHFDPWSQLPSSIVLYQKNLERYARDRKELEEEIETTVLHEVGHYLGWDEEDLYERGLD